MCNDGIKQRRHSRWSEWSTAAKVGVVAVVVVGIPGIFTLCGLVTMWLWNALMPAIFGLPVIGFWQALGLLALSHILFKSSATHRAARSHWRKRQVWRHMQDAPDQSPEHA